MKCTVEDSIRAPALAIFIALAGCAANVPNAKDIDTSGREPNCARQCLATYSDCVSRASLGNAGEVIHVRTMRACYSAADACVSTCPKP